MPIFIESALYSEWVMGIVRFSWMFACVSDVSGCLQWVINPYGEIIVNI